MSSPLALRITDAGTAMVAQAIRGEISSIGLSAVAFGEGFGAVTGGEESLRVEKIRVPILEASNPSPDCINIRANVTSSTPQWVREIGIFAGSVLFAYCASEGEAVPLAYIAPGTEMLFSQDLYIKSLAIDKITIVIDPNAQPLAALIRLHEQSANPHGITEALATMLASQCNTNMLILINNYLKPEIMTILDGQGV